MAKYQKTGALEHVNKYSNQYGFATAQTFTESMAIVTRARNMFDALPSSIRTKFNGDPGAFLDFVQDPDNKSEMAELGLSGKQPENTNNADEIVAEKPKSVETDASTVDPT